MYENIIYSVSSEGIANIVLNRPEVLNSLDAKTCQELTAAFDSCRKDETVKVIILSANGKGFCAGQDLKYLLESKKIIPSEVIKENYFPLVTSIREIPKPIICKLQGIAAGAGCSLALACDVIIASEDAILSEAFVGIGLVPDSGSSYFLPQLVGRMKAFELLSLGTKISAAEALQLGIVNKVVPKVSLDQEIINISNAYLNSPLQAVGLIKKLLNKSYHSTLEEILDLEAKYQDKAAATSDFAEGLLAFKQKRKPKFKGI